MKQVMNSETRRHGSSPGFPQKCGGVSTGAAAVGMAGQEGDIFRRVLFWSIVLTLVMCVIVYAQSTSILDWMVP